MKKIRYFLLLCLFAIITTGCVKYNATMSIKKDKSMDFTIIYAMDKALMSMGGSSSELKEEEFDGLKKAGYSVEKYSDDKYEGFKLSKKFANIDEISTDKDVEFDLSGMEESDSIEPMFKVVKGEKKNTYYAKFKFDSSNSSLSTDTEESDEGDVFLPDENKDLEVTSSDETLTTTGSDEVITTTGEEDDEDLTIGSSDTDLDLSSLTNAMDLSFSVTLPNAAISTNATTKEDGDKKLTWKLDVSGTQTIEFAFEIDANAGNNNLLLYVGIGAGVLVILILIFLLTRKKGPKEIVPVNDNYVEIKNDVNDEVQEEPVPKKETQVVNDNEDA